MTKQEYDSIVPGDFLAKRESTSSRVLWPIIGLGTFAEEPIFVEFGDIIVVIGFHEKSKMGDELVVVMLPTGSLITVYKTNLQHLERINT